jgi:His/Glu/Gln/Arg/opine family amino acid ABC transporter permease subunit
MSFDWLIHYGTVAYTYAPDLAVGLGKTLVLVTISALIGFVLSLPVAMGRASSNLLLSAPAYLYTLVFRGSPLFVQIFLIYFGVGQFEFVRESIFWPLLREAYFCALLAFSLNTAAYLAELIRGGIQAVPYGEREAALACGMSRWTLYRRILLPRAIRLTLPAQSNEIILLLKATSLASTVTVLDLMGVARALYTRTYDTTPLYVVAPIYLLLVWGISVFFRQMEKRYNRFMAVRT